MKEREKEIKRNNKEKERRNGWNKEIDKQRKKKERKRRGDKKKIEKFDTRESKGEI